MRSCLPRLRPHKSGHVSAQRYGRSRAGAARLASRRGLDFQVSLLDNPKVSTVKRAGEKCRRQEATEMLGGEDNGEYLGIAAAHVAPRPQWPILDAMAFDVPRWLWLPPGGRRHS